MKKQKITKQKITKTLAFIAISVSIYAAIYMGVHGSKFGFSLLYIILLSAYAGWKS